MYHQIYCAPYIYNQKTTFTHLHSPGVGVKYFFTNCVINQWNSLSQDPSLIQHGSPGVGIPLIWQPQGSWPPSLCMINFFYWVFSNTLGTSVGEGGQIHLLSPPQKPVEYLQMGRCCQGWNADGNTTAKQRQKNLECPFLDPAAIQTPCGRHERNNWLFVSFPKTSLQAFLCCHRL